MVHHFFHGWNYKVIGTCFPNTEQSMISNQSSITLLMLLYLSVTKTKDIDNINRKKRKNVASTYELII
jgi:hypothetical protein